MRHDTIEALLKQQPFRPFRLHMTNGTVFEITHPDMAIAGRNTLTLTLPPEAAIEREAVIALLHIMWIEKRIPST